MEEEIKKTEEKIIEEKNTEGPKRLSMPATVLITIVATLGAIVVARLLLFLATGD